MVQVESWLNRVLERMCNTLRMKFGDAVQAYEEKPREQWLFDYPAQVCCPIHRDRTRTPRSVLQVWHPGGQMA